MYEQKDINYDFDYDEEKKTVRKSIGMICLCLGAFLLIVITYFFVRDIKLAITGHHVTATIEKEENIYTATYIDDAGKKHKYELDAYVNIFNRKTIGIYYQEKLSNADFIYWEIYLISYILYGFMIWAGICYVRNQSAFVIIKDSIKKLFKEKANPYSIEQ